MSTEEKSEAALEHLKEIGKIRIADEAIMMQDVQELLAMEREKVRAHNRRFLGGDFEEHDMGNIHIGDVNQSAPLVSTPSAPSSLTRKAIAAGLLALGGSAGAGGLALYEYLTRPQPPAAESFVDTDTDTEYEMKLVPEQGDGED
jgi:hypothetical protein